MEYIGKIRGDEHIFPHTELSSILYYYIACHTKTKINLHIFIGHIKIKFITPFVHIWPWLWLCLYGTNDNYLEQQMIGSEFLWSAQVLSKHIFI